MISVVWRGYLKLLDKHPLLMMATTTGTLMGTGDAISQLAIERKGIKGFDVIRSGRYVVLGFFVIGPGIRGWYLALDRLYAGTRFAAIKMVATDQIVMAPIIISVFLSGMGILRGDSVGEIKGKLSKDYFTVLMNNYKLWPMAQIINFQFMPLQHRVLFVNFVSLFWNVYLAWIAEQ